MTTIHQEIVVLSHVTCDVWDCTSQSMTASATVEATEDQVARGTVAVTAALNQSSIKLFEDARQRGWVIGAHNNVCPVHVQAAIYEYVKAKNEQQASIEVLS